jgi:ribose 5-phosphate isomerase B
MRIAIGSDHAGFRYKERIIQFLREKGFTVFDFGTNSEDAVDYPDYIRPVAEAVAKGSYDRGIVLGGSGNGEAIVANKVRGIRCAVCWDVQTAIWARSHNDANVLALGERTVNIDTALSIVDTWLKTSFDGGRHLRRIQKIESTP